MCLLVSWMLMGYFLMEPGFKFNLGFFGALFFSSCRSMKCSQLYFTLFKKIVFILCRKDTFLTYKLSNYCLVYLNNF